MEMPPRSGEEMVAIELVEETPATAQAKALLEAQLQQYDLRPYLFTQRVRIAPAGSPRSHPVLTLTPRLVAQPDRFLSVFLHEQMHWFLAGIEARTEAAIAALRARYPDPPHDPDLVARDAHSTYLHLVVNWLELQALTRVIGRKRAHATLAGADVYRWIYQTVLQDEAEIGTLLAAPGIALPS